LKHNKDADCEAAWNVTTSANQKDPVLVQADAARQVPGRNLFSFDDIFHGHQSTVEVYRTVAKPVVDAVVTGRHGTVFAYGQTGSGKTHTMQGNSAEDHSATGHVVSFGIVQMAAIDMLEQMRRHGDEREYTLHAQFFEIYNEQVRDLLHSVKSTDYGDSSDRLKTCASTCSSSKGDLTVLTVREERGPDGKTSATVNAHKARVKSVHDIASILEQGNLNRACAATSMNAQSSRSHAIFRLTLESHAKDSMDARVRRSVLNLVDLAGSENTSQSGVTGIRKKEAGKINQRYVALEC
jgi:kinesin family protein 11